MATITKRAFPPGGDVNIGWKLEVGTTVTFLCAAIVVFLRSLARWKYSKRGWDDYVMVFALLQALVATIFDYIAVNYGLGRHTVYLTIPQAINQEYYSLLAQVFCVNALTFAKISIILSYLRVLQGSQNYFQKASLWLMGILVFVVNTLVIITFYVSCSPRKKAWDPLVPGTCWPILTRLGFILLQGSFSAFSDFFLALFPILLLQKLQISRGSKAIVLGLMSLGSITGIFAIIRTAESGTQLHTSPKAAPDVSFSTVLGLMWAGMERNIAIMVGSAPTLRPLVMPATRFITETLGSSRLLGSQSYQMTDRSKSGKTTDYVGRSHNTGKISTMKTGGTSEEHILPEHSQYVA